MSGPKGVGRGLLALSSPLLILLALAALLLRQGPDRWQALPALLIGAGLLGHSALTRRRRQQSPAPTGAARLSPAAQARP